MFTGTGGSHAYGFVPFGIPSAKVGKKNSKISSIFGFEKAHKTPVLPNVLPPL